MMQLRILMLGLVLGLPFMGRLCAQPAAAPAPKVTTVQADKARERNYVYEVKIIDEFIERFNDDSDSYVRTDRVSRRGMQKVDRPKMILSLFNSSTATRSKAIVDSFIEQITDSVEPYMLHFTDADWYAELPCFFTSASSKSLPVTLVLQVVSKGDSGSTWMITGISDAPLFRNHKAAAPATGREEPLNPAKSISPADYASNFLELYRVFTKSMNANNYFTPELLQTSRATEFVNLVKSGQIHFSHSLEPKFYFFQVPNYSFTVERFQRNSTNSGWLISSLRSATAEEKTAQQETLLRRSIQ